MTRLSKTPQTIWIVLLGTLGFLAGISLINFRANENPCSAGFAATPQFSIWYGLIGFEAAIWSIFSVSLWQNLKQFKHYVQKRWLEILFTLILVTLLAVLMFADSLGFVDRLRIPLYGFAWKANLLNLVGFTLCLMAGSGIWLVQIALKSSVLQNSQSDNQKIIYFLNLRDALQQFLFSAGTIIGASTLATGILHRAVSTWHSEIASTISAECKRMAVQKFSPEIILFYGLYLSAILALVYIPTHQTLMAVGRQLCDDLLPMPNFHDAEWSAWTTKRKALEEVLKLNLSIKQSFETGVAIFAPLVTSSISFLLGKA